MKYIVNVGENSYEIEITQDVITLDGEPMDVDFASIGDLHSLLVNNESFEAMIDFYDGFWNVLMRGDLYQVDVIDERTQLLRERSGGLVDDSAEVVIKAPMPGLVIAVVVEVGQEVEAGDNIVILESMKMENELKTPRAGRVEHVTVSDGDSVEQNQTLVVIV